MRAVLDANILIAALLSRNGPPAQILARWLAGEFELVVSVSLLDELERALGYSRIRSRVTPVEAAEFLALLAHAAIVVADPPVAPARSADDADDCLVALAESAQAVLVSGDKHLLDLALALPIQSAREFLDTLERG